jgi:hypothetical protein
LRPQLIAVIGHALPGLLVLRLKELRKTLLIRAVHAPRAIQRIAATTASLILKIRTLIQIGLNLRLRLGNGSCRRRT